MKGREEFRPPAVGGASALVVFCVLCLTVLSLLSLSTALAERRMAEVSRETERSWYAADLQAQEIYARLRRGERPSGVSVCNNIYRFRCPVSREQWLEAELEYKEGEWTVLRWQSVAQVPEEEAVLPVWEGIKKEE